MINEEDIDNILNNNDIVLLKFSADWCNSCKKYEYFINDLNVNVTNIDHDLNEDLVEEYEITILPTVLIFKNKNLVEKIEGFITKSDFIKKLSSIQ